MQVRVVTQSAHPNVRPKPRQFELSGPSPPRKLVGAALHTPGWRPLYGSQTSLACGGEVLGLES